MEGIKNEELKIKNDAVLGVGFFCASVILSICHPERLSSWAFVILSMSRIKRGRRTLSRLTFHRTRPPHRDKVLRDKLRMTT